MAVLSYVDKWIIAESFVILSFSQTLDLTHEGVNLSL